MGNCCKILFFFGGIGLVGTMGLQLLQVHCESKIGDQPGVGAVQREIHPCSGYENGVAGLLGSGTALDGYRSFLRYEIVSSLAPAPELPFSQRPWGPTLPCPAPLAMVSGSPHPDWV